jgi:hypothetical protein
MLHARGLAETTRIRRLGVVRALLRLRAADVRPFIDQHETNGDSIFFCHGVLPHGSSLAWPIGTFGQAQSRTESTPCLHCRARK